MRYPTALYLTVSPALHFQCSSLPVQFESELVAVRFPPQGVVFYLLSLVTLALMGLLLAARVLPSL